MSMRLVLYMRSAMRICLPALAVMLAILAPLGSGAVAEPISSIVQVAGKWRSKSGALTLEIKADGTFSVTYPSATRSGSVKIMDGALVLPFSNNQGRLELALNDGTLEGSYLIDIAAGPLRVERVARAQ
jgi:hypothetical protein